MLFTNCFCSPPSKTPTPTSRHSSQFNNNPPSGASTPNHQEQVLLMGNSTSQQPPKKSTSSGNNNKHKSTAAPAKLPPSSPLVPDALHQSVVPTNPKLEALQTDREVLHQIQEIQAHNPRKTLQGTCQAQSITTSTQRPYTLNIGYLSQTGYYPEDLNKANQDMVSILPDLPHSAKQSKLHFLGVYDGHGKVGDLCSAFARDKVPVYLQRSAAFKRADAAFDEAVRDAYLATNLEMHHQEKLGKFSDMMSGTTAITALISDSTLYIANVGDSRAIMGVRDPIDGKLRAEALSIDQTPFREDERARVKLCGARVLTMDQIEGYRDVNEDQFGTEEEDDGDPPRLWCQEGAYPGTAFTRSLGDQVAERIGVCADPEITVRELDSTDEFLLIASDGVFEFLSSQAVVDIVSHYIKNETPLEACRAVVSEAYRLWLQFEVRTDDISIIIVKFQGLNSTATSPKRTAIERSKSILQREPSLRNTNVQVEVRPVRRNLSRVKQGAVGQTHIDPKELEGYTLPVYPKSPEECQRIKSAVRANFLFRHLNDDQLDKAVNAMDTVLVKENEVIIRQFDEGDRFYIADFGEFDVEVAVPNAMLPGTFDPPRKVFTYDTKHGNNPCFGELALMYSKPRAATVKASTDGRLWALERKAFRSILMKTPARRLVQVLKRVEVLKPLNKTDFQRMADLMTEETYADGEYVCRQGDEGDAFYIIIEGKCIVTKSEFGNAAPPVKVMELTDYMYFGERSLLHDVPRAANVICEGGPVKLLSIHRRDFEEVVGKIADMVDRDRFQRENKSRRQLLGDSKSSKNLLDERAAYEQVKSPAELDGGVWNTGSFVAGSGTVRIAQHKGKAVVLKSFNKKQMLGNNREELALVLNELRVARMMHSSSSVFVPTLLGVFQTGKLLHMLLSSNESDITDLASFFGKPQSLEQVKYLVLGLASAFEFLHGPMQLVYRGLVPEAVGLDRRGVVQLLDFRFAKALLDDSRTFTVVGTPEYMSPEQVAGIGHGFEADWWSLGILAYEALVGQTPWGDANELGIYSAISSFSNSKLQFPSTVDSGAIEFVRAMLQADVADRLQQAVDVTNHAFVKSASGENPFELQLNKVFGSMRSGAKVDAEAMENQEEGQDVDISEWTLA